uniref:Nuclear transcription factor Y subunit beta n=1 Tax=Angiostrongylus cantonensis TaxID=6313 RepID=A0A0K0CW76_ANGCA
MLFVVWNKCEGNLTESFLRNYHSLQESMKIRFQRGDGDEEASDNRSNNPIPDQERFLPIANVARVMKRMIPSSGKIAKDAKECVQECVSEFISFITSEANDKCLSEKRKTISADDLLDAITNMGFDNYVAPLQLFLDSSTPVVISGGLGGMSVTALQQQPMQIYVDPVSKQHYMAIESGFRFSSRFVHYLPHSFRLHAIFTSHDNKIE